MAGKIIRFSQSQPLRIESKGGWLTSGWKPRGWLRRKQRIEFEK
jgi:hypothetical protein